MPARQSKRLSSRTVETAQPGKYADGDNLYLIVSATGSRKWVLRFTSKGKAREMGLGRANAGNLKDARERAQDANRLIAKGIDPIAARKQDKAVPTFGEMAKTVAASLSAGFRNEKHKAQWTASLDMYASRLSTLPVNVIDTNQVLDALKPIWLSKAETASRVRGRIEKVLDAAKAKGFRHGENPARWRGHLDHLLPRQSKLSRGHHAAMPYQEVPAFVVSLRAREAVAARALEFCILTAARSGEVLCARWSEIDVETAVWTIPAERMKAGRVHQVPLSARALEILKALKGLGSKVFVFPGRKIDKPLSSMAMEMILRRMKIDNATVHGFRSSFRDWAGDSTRFPRELAEQALAHVIGNKVEQAYRRQTALEQRRNLMRAWDEYLTSNTTSNVIQLLGTK